MALAYSFRPATVADADRIADIHVDSWREAYSGFVPASHLNSLSKTTRADRWARTISERPGSVVLAVAQDELRGWVSFGPSRDPGGDAEIYALYVAPSHKRQGAGSGLLAFAENTLRKSGYRAAALWVLEMNTPGRRFYECQGYVADTARKTVEMGGAHLAELRYRKSLGV